MSIIALVALGALFVNTRPAFAASSGTWTTTGSLTTTRVGHTMTQLADGRVLIAGGDNYYANTSAEVYTPTAGTWGATGNLNANHDQGAAVLLANGQVLIAGNFDPYFGDGTSAELYNPATGAWSLTGSMATGRANFGLVRLPDGRVLAVGGGDSGLGFVSSAEIYNPATGVWSPTGSLHVARGYFELVVLPNGNVLAAGGDSFNYSTGIETVLTSAEIYHPATGNWTYTGSMHTPRTNFTSTLLTNGKVLVAGGSSNSAQGGAAVAGAELYNPATGTWSVTGSLASARMNHTATLLSNGNVLVAGGYHVITTLPYVATSASAELYNPTTGKWTGTGNLNTARYAATAALLANHTVLLAGGQYVNSNGNGIELASAEIYIP